MRCAMRFSANVSILFPNTPFVERFARAKAAGFSAVEFWWPSGEDLAKVEAAIHAAELKVVLINFDAGNMPAGDRGLLSNPERDDEFRANVPVALAFAERLGCKKLNALVGVQLPNHSRDEQLKLARQNIGWVADQAAAQGATIMIEAVNTIENGPYLLHTTAQAADFIREVGRPNVKLQYDAYHMQRMEGNLVATMRAHADGIAHVQLADSPGRGEPGTGEIHFSYVLKELEALGYEGYVGLEYKASGGGERAEESYEWLPLEGRSGDVPVSALKL
jgi:hydroxypyruvate isomerase